MRLRLTAVVLVAACCSPSGASDEGMSSDTGGSEMDPADCRNRCSLELACDWEDFDTCMSTCEMWLDGYPDCVEDLQTLNLCIAQLSCEDFDSYLFEKACPSDEFPCATEDNAFFGCLGSCG